MSVNNLNQEQVSTREEYKKAKQLAAQQAKQANKRAEQAKEAQSSEEQAQTAGKVRVRLIPIWLRLVLLVVAMILCVTLGAMVGYGMLGDGNALDVLKESTWTHIVDLVNKK